MQFGKLLRQRRKELGLRQQDVAADTGISHITYGDYERGRCFPKDTTLRMLCDVLKLDYDEMSAAIVESKRLADIAKAEQRAKTHKMMIGKDKWSEEISSVEQPQEIHLELQLPSLAVTGNLGEDGAIHGQVKKSDIRVRLGEGWENAIAAQAPAGRFAEFQLLCHLAKHAQDGRGQVVSIAGEAGIGKSHLLSAMLKYLKNQQFTVVEASCRENIDDVPYYPFAVLLDALSEDKSLADKWDAELPLLRRLLPSKHKIMQEQLWQSSPLTKKQRQQMLINNLLRAFKIAAQRNPLAIIIEDAHWMDEPSQELTKTLAGRISSHQFYFLLAYRPQLEAPWVYAKNHTQLYLPPLKEEHLEAALIEQLKPGQLAPDERDWIYRKTGGNPFHAKELVRELIESESLIRRTRWWKFNPEKEPLDIAEEVEQVIAHRLARLEEDHKPFLKYAATIASPFSKAQAQMAVGKSSDAAFEALEKAGIVHYEPRRGIYHFVHDLTQETAYVNIPEAERAHWHRQAAKTLEATSETIDLETALKIADHYMKAGEMSKKAEYLLKAAKEARKYMLYPEAQSYLQQALELLDERSEVGSAHPTIRLDVLEQLDIVAEYISNHRQRIDYLKEAIRLSELIEASPRRRASLYHRLTNVYSYLNDNIAKIDAAKEGLALLADEPSCWESLHLWHELAKAYMAEGMRTEMWEALKQELNIAESEGNLYWLVMAIRQHANTLRLEGDIHRAIERYMHAYNLAAKDDNTYDQCRLAIGLGYCWEDMGELEEASEWYNQGLTIAEQIYRWDILPHESHKFALLTLRSGMHQKEVEQHLIRAVELIGKIGLEERQGLANAFLGRFYCHQERWSEARQRLEKAVEQLSEMETGSDLVGTLGCLEWSLAKLGEQEAFPALCLKLRKHGNRNPNLPQQWHLKPASPTLELADEVFLEKFDGGEPDERWRFRAGCDDADYEISEAGGIILHAPYDCDLFPQVNMDAPRMVMELSGDFAVEVEIEILPEEPVQAGGIILWQDDYHFFRFERGTFGANELRFGYVDEQEDERARMIRLGRGYLNANSYRLRLERMGTHVRALVNADNKWLSCGEYEVTLCDPISVGFYALCPDVSREFYPKVDVAQAKLWVKEFRIIAYTNPSSNI